MFIFSLLFLTHPAPTELYTLSLHDALPISGPGRWPPPRAGGAARTRTGRPRPGRWSGARPGRAPPRPPPRRDARTRSEEHTSELQSRQYLVCRLLLEKKKRRDNIEENAHDS